MPLNFGKLVSHDNVVSWAFEGSFRKKRETDWQGKKGRCRKVGGLEKSKDVVRTVLQSGPLRLRADKDQGCNCSNFVLVLKRNGHVSVQCGRSFWPLARNC